MIYTENNRGIIQDRENFHQKVLYGGMRYGKCMPTDIDAMMEFNNKVCIMWELKYGSAPIPYGQKTLMERNADKWNQCGDIGIVFRCSHMTPSDRDISLADSIVTDTYYNGTWHREKIAKRVKDRTDEFLRWCRDVKGIDLGNIELDDETIRRAIL